MVMSNQDVARTAHVSIRGIRKGYGAAEVIRGIDLDVAQSEFMVFVGPSGSGKSTMLRMIAGLENISAGDLFIDGVRVNDVAPSKRGAAMVFQNYALYPHMTVAENMGFSLRVAGAKAAAIRAAVEQTASMLQMGDLLDRYPRELSGGQQQRVAIGRAIVRKPRVFLFDEPLSNLDAALRVQMRIELSRLHKALDTTMIYVTHDQVEAMTMGDRIAVFSAGCIAQVGTPLEIYFNPANEFVASFIGSPRINLMGVRVEGSSLKVAGTQVCLPLPASLADSDAGKVARIGIRAEHLQLVDGAGLRGKVELSENLGSEIILYLKIDGLAELITVKTASAGHAPKVGDAVAALPDPSQVLCFDWDGNRVAGASKTSGA